MHHECEMKRLEMEMAEDRVMHDLEMKMAEHRVAIRICMLELEEYLHHKNEK
jgi:hypothetical protein